MNDDEISNIIDLYLKNGELDKELFNKFFPRPKLVRQQAVCIVESKDIFKNNIKNNNFLETMKTKKIKLKN
tara:strand:- start:5986 stop:6198 length:213 start_codon:yes stop_codon:yes gene_type:complete